MTTDGEFHTLRRQTRRLAEAGLDVEIVSAEPADTLAERLAAAASDLRTRAVLVSSVLFESARIVPHLGALAERLRRRIAPSCSSTSTTRSARSRRPLRSCGLERAWIVGGGYKYLQLGEGNCFMRLPEHA